MAAITGGLEWLISWFDLSFAKSDRLLPAASH
jgi:hypothetical protein